MQSQEKFSLLRSILKALGLSPEAVDDIVDRIVDFLSDKDDKARELAKYPYRIRDDFLSPAEQSFYLVLKNAVGDWALACPKVALGDLFYVKSGDPSEFRILTNKIDRKHVDFLICDPRTIRPLLGIELDDKSHQRDDRRARDEFVERVFMAAKLPLMRVAARQAYPVAELTAAIRQRISLTTPQGAAQPSPAPAAPTSPRCPKCGGEMVLRTAKTGANQGQQFWGCLDYPKCHGIVRYEGQTAQ